MRTFRVLGCGKGAATKGCGADGIGADGIGAGGIGAGGIGPDTTQLFAAGKQCDQYI